MRLRALLGTVPAYELPEVETDATLFTAAAELVLADLVPSLQAHQSTHLLLGFPAAPFILALSTAEKEAFRAFAAKRPSHAVRIRRRGGTSGEWLASPVDEPDAYQLTFTLSE